MPPGPGFRIQREQQENRDQAKENNCTNSTWDAQLEGPHAPKRSCSRANPIIFSLPKSRVRVPD